jgi:hypothetical protein
MSVQTPDGPVVLVWGEALAERLKGIYAFAIWDFRQNKLVMIRDRLGIKPLYYHPTAHGALFDPELPFPRPLGVQVMHAHKDDSPVPKTQSSWRTVNGVRLVTTHRSAIVLFRCWGCGEAMLETGVFTKSSFGDGVEVMHSVAGYVLVRHGSDPDGPRHRFTRQEWEAFMAGVRNREFDLPDGEG